MSETTTKTEPRTVHVLRYGRTLCGSFVGLMPKDWPTGNVWAGPSDAAYATCAGCVPEAQRLGLR